jgi:hypothetical protein
MNSLDWASLGVHVSLGDQAGWAYLDVFRPSSSDTPGNPDPLANWKPYTNEIIQVKLDGASVRRLAHARARLTNQWYNQPVASISRDGRTLAFVSNFGYGNYDVTQYNDVYLIQPIHLGSGAPVYTLSVNKTGNGSGVVSSDPAGIDCGTVCSADFVVGTLVTLNSLADTGSAFSGWSGACSGAGSCVVTMNAAQSVTATFTTVAPTWTRVEQASSDVTWVGNWPNNSSSLHSGGSARRGRVAGNLSTFSFTGTSARWIGYNDALSGLARVYLDGVLQTQVDTYAGATQPQQINYTTPALASGSHTLTIEVSGAKNSGSKNNWIYVDAFEFTP